MSDDLTVIAWNAQVGRPPADVVDAVGDLIRDHSPDVIALFEASGYIPALRRVEGYRVRHRRSDVVVLVRRGRRIDRVRVLATRVRWWGPKHGLPHEGRANLLLNVDGWRLVLVHRVWGGLIAAKNRPAWNAEDALLLSVAARGLGRPLLMVGDQNVSPGETMPGSPAALAVAVGARVVRTGAMVDWGIARGCRVKARRLPNYGSDHPAILYTATRA